MSSLRSSRWSDLMVVCIAVCTALLALTGCGHRALVPRSTDAVDVTWSQPHLPGGESLGVAGRGHLTGAAAAAIVHWLNGLPAWRSSDTCADACPFPLFYEAEPAFTVHLPAGTAVFAYRNDFEVDVTIDGRPEQPLSAWSSPSVPDSQTIMRELLRLPPPSRS